MPTLSAFLCGGSVADDDDHDHGKVNDAGGADDVDDAGDAGDAGDADEDEVVRLAWEDGGDGCEPNSHVSLFN